jgi:hypothetical protein
LQHWRLHREINVELPSDILSFPFFLFLLADGGGYALALANPADFDLVGDFENNGMPGRIIYRDSGAEFMLNINHSS